MDLGSISMGSVNTDLLSIANRSSLDAVSDEAEGKAAEGVAEESVAAEGTAAEEAAVQKNTEAAVYEPNSHKGANALDEETIKAMKDELAARTQSLAEMMLGKQVDALALSDESFWQKFRTGDFTVDAETQAQAQKDIAEDGYWGVEQTSDRIIKYARALSGDDPEKLDTMIQAFEKGFKEATKTWGGDLPDLTQRTRDAVLKKFEDLREQYGKSSEEDTKASGVLAAAGAVNID